MKIPYHSDGAPPSEGTHTQALRVGNMVFVNNQTGRDPISGELAEGLAAQTHRTLANVEAILAAAGCEKTHLVKITMMMTDIKHFKEIDDIYRAWLPPREVSPYPTRAAFAAHQLPAGALVALDGIAVTD